MINYKRKNAWIW